MGTLRAATAEPHRAAPDPLVGAAAITAARQKPTPVPPDDTRCRPVRRDVTIVPLSGIERRPARDTR
jgi:hypothetical protein